MPEIYFTHVDDIPGSDTPARCNRMTGEIIINRRKFKNIPPAHRLFILLHEYAHIELNSSDEFQVDKRAQELFLQMGYPLTESVLALSRVLNPHNPSHVARTKAILASAQKIDNFNNQPMKTENLYEPSKAFYEDIFGFGKTAKAKKEAKIDKKQSKADAIRAKAQAKLELAKQGIAPKSGAQGIIGGILGTATQIFGGDGASIANTVSGNDNPNPEPMLNQPMPVVTEEKPGFKKYLPWIIGGAVLVVGTIIFFVVRKKK